MNSQWVPDMYFQESNDVSPDASMGDFMKSKFDIRGDWSVATFTSDVFSTSSGAKTEKTKNSDSDFLAQKEHNKNVLQTDIRCQRGPAGFANIDNCFEAFKKEKHVKKFQKEEAIQKLLAGTVLISTQCRNPDTRINDLIPDDQELSGHLNKLLAKTRNDDLAAITKKYDRIRDELGAVVITERNNKKEKVVQENKKAVPLPVQRDQKGKGYLSPRQLIKNLRRSQRSEAGFETIPEADMNRLKNSMWRIETDNYEMVYPVSCEIRNRNRFLKAAEKRHLGPGTYYVNEYEDIQRKKKMDLGKGYLKCQTQRFPPDKPAQNFPTPTSYGNPYDNLNKSNSGALRTIFATAQPFRKANVDSSGPDMCSYDTVRPDINCPCKGKIYPQNVAQQLKSMNGEPRGLVKYGYFKTNKSEAPDTTFIPKTFVQLICEKKQPKCGVFSTIERDVYDGAPLSVRQRRPEHDKDSPGPGHYSHSYLQIGNPKKVTATVAKKNVEEKLCCIMKTRYEEPASPAFYNERRGFKYLYKGIIGNGARHDFNSGSSRILKHKTAMFLEERLKGLNIRRDERFKERDSD